MAEDEKKGNGEEKAKLTKVAPGTFDKKHLRDDGDGEHSAVNDKTKDNSSGKEEEYDRDR
jgi:hypothetical protein